MNNLFSDPLEQFESVLLFDSVFNSTLIRLVVEVYVLFYYVMVEYIKERLIFITYPGDSAVWYFLCCLRKTNWCDSICIKYFFYGSGLERGKDIILGGILGGCLGGLSGSGVGSIIAEGATSVAVTVGGICGSIIGGFITKARGDSKVKTIRAAGLEEYTNEKAFVENLIGGLIAGVVASLISWVLSLLKKTSKDKESGKITEKANENKGVDSSKKKTDDKDA